MLEIKDLTSKSLSEVLVYVANPDWLLQRIVPKGKSVLETMTDENLEELRKLVASKLENIISHRDQLVQRINAVVMPQRRPTVMVAENYRELLDTLLHRPIWTPDVQALVRRQEERVRKEAPSQAKVDIPLTDKGGEVGLVNRFLSGINPSWLEVLEESKVNLQIESYASAPNDILYVQRKNKTAYRTALRIGKEIILEERAAALTGEQPEILAVNISDFAAARWVHRYGLPIGPEATLFTNPRTKRSRSDQGIEKVLHEILRYPAIEVSRDDEGELQYDIAEPENHYAMTEKRTNSVHLSATLPMKRGLVVPYPDYFAEESISMHATDIYNELEDQIGRRSHLLYKFRQQNRGRQLEEEKYTEEEEFRRTLYAGRVDDFLLTVPEFQERIAA